MPLLFIMSFVHPNRIVLSSFRTHSFYSLSRKESGKLDYTISGLFLEVSCNERRRMYDVEMGRSSRRACDFFE